MTSPVFVKIRSLGKYGIIADIDPYDLPPEAFSAGKNIRFRNGRVSRAPVWRSAASLQNTAPRWVVSSTLNSGEDNVFVCNLDGTVVLTTPAAQTDYSVSGYTPTDLDTIWSNAHLENVLYVNRTDRTPWYYDGTVDNFKLLPNWGLVFTSGGGNTVSFTATVTEGSNQLTNVSSTNGLIVGMGLDGSDIEDGCTITEISGSTVTMSATANSSGTSQTITAMGTNQIWTAGLIRECGGALVALNMTINGTGYPGMLITSSFPEAGAAPASWDYANPSTSATQNTLEDLEGGILDACSLGSNLIIYGFNSAWMMIPTTGFEEFDYFKLPFAKGAINANCSVEVNGRNYVFGPDDIWVHDGYIEQSIASDRVRDYIFGSLNFSQTNRCFVLHNPALKELYFCYVSGDSLVAFDQSSVGGCNRCATYNYQDDNWTFDDMPSIYGGTYANLASTPTWESITGTWATVGGSWQSQDQNLQRTTCFVGDSSAAYSLTSQLYAFDLFGTGSTTAFNVDTNATMGAHLERDGIDLDQVQGIDLPDYKLFSSVFPLARIDANANTTLNIAFGTSDYYGQAATFDGPTMTFGNGDYKGDFNMAGRYASLHIDYNDYTTFSISGFDFLIDEEGQR